MSFKNFAQFITESGQPINEARVNVTQVFQAWEQGRANERQNSIWTDGDSIYSYGTALVARAGDNSVVFNTTKYSITTSGQQKSLRLFLEEAGMEVIEVGEQPFGISAYTLLSVANKTESDPDAPSASSTPDMQSGDDY